MTQVIGSQLSRNVGGALSSQLISLGRNLYTKGLDQEDEFEADRAGVALAARAGFDPYGLVAALHQLRLVTPDNPAFTLTISTHPAAQVRLDQVELAMGNRLDSLSGKPAPTLPQRLEQLAAAGPSQSAAASPAPAAAPATPTPATKPQALANVKTSAFAAGDVLVPKVAGVKAYRDANETRELTTLAKTDEVVFDGTENGGFMKVVTPKGSAWVKAIMLRKP